MPRKIYRILELVRHAQSDTDQPNKRQRLAQSTIRLKSPSILSYRRIHHTSLTDWRFSIVALL